MEYIIGPVSKAVAVIILVIAAVIDIRTGRIPDKLVFTGTAAGLVLLFFNTQVGLLSGLAGGVSVGLIMLLVFKITGGGLGFGDVKLFSCIGIYLGIEDTFSAMLTAVILCGLYSLILISISRENKKREIPFAPFILAGSLGAIFL